MDVPEGVRVMRVILEALRVAFTILAAFVPNSEGWGFEKETFHMRYIYVKKKTLFW